MSDSRTNGSCVCCGTVYDPAKYATCPNCTPDVPLQHSCPDVVEALRELTEAVREQTRVIREQSCIPGERGEVEGD